MIGETIASRTGSTHARINPNHARRAMDSQRTVSPSHNHKKKCEGQRIKRL